MPENSREQLECLAILINIPYNMMIRLTRKEEKKGDQKREENS